MSTAKRPKLDDSNDTRAAKSSSNFEFKCQDESNLSLREIVKASFKIQADQINKLKDTLDELMTNTNKFLVVRTLCAGSAHGDASLCELSLYLHSPQAFEVWKSCVNAAIIEIGTPENAISTSGQLRITLNLKPAELKNLLEYLRPLSVVTHFERVELDENDSLIIQSYEGFFCEASVDCFDFSSKMGYCLSRNRNQTRTTENFDQLIRLVRKIRPLEVAHSQRDMAYRKGITDFFVNAADIVEKISIDGREQSRTRDKAFPLDIVKKILSRKCSSLHIGDNITKMKKAEVMKLIQFFQSTGKKVSLAIGADGSTKSGTFEEYIVETEFTNMFTFEKNLLLIEHKDVNPRAKDAKWFKRMPKSFENMAMVFEEVKDEKKELDVQESLNEPTFIWLPVRSRDIIDTKLSLKSLLEMLKIARDHLKIQSREILNFEKWFTKSTTKRVKVKQLYIRSALQNDKFELSFSFNTFNGCSLWTTIFIWALFRINIPHHVLRISNRRGANFRHCSNSRHRLSIILEEEELKRLNTHLQIITSRTNFEQVIIEGGQRGALYALAEFLEKQKAKKIIIRPYMISRNNFEQVEIFDFTPLLNLIRKVCPSSVKYERIKFTKALLDFLIQVAEVVETICIGRFAYYENIKEDRVPSSALKEILGRNCNCLQIANTANKLTLAEIEEMIQFMHHIDKKASLSFGTEVEPIYAQFGEYNLKMTTFPLQWDYEELLVIEHVHMSPNDDSYVI